MNVRVYLTPGHHANSSVDFDDVHTVKITPNGTLLITFTNSNDEMAFAPSGWTGYHLEDD
jgi:hypothetical protein